MNPLCILYNITIISYFNSIFFHITTKKGYLLHKIIHLTTTLQRKISFFVIVSFHYNVKSLFLLFLTLCFLFSPVKLLHIFYNNKNAYDRRYYCNHTSNKSNIGNGPMRTNTSSNPRSASNSKIIDS